MGKRWASILALGAVLAVGWVAIAGAYGPTIVKLGFAPIDVNGGFKPTRLPKSKLAPVHFVLEGDVSAAGGTRIPVLEQLIVELDKNVAIDGQGLASCGGGKIAGPDVLPPPEGGCKAARIGKGEMEFEVEFPEVEPFIEKAHVIAINGGVSAGVTTIFLYAHLPAPVSAAAITTVKVSKLHSGPYGVEWTATIPTVAGGSGALKKFQLEFFRVFTYKGKKQSYISARCPAGKLRAHWEAAFADGSTHAAEDFNRPCTERGRIAAADR